MKNWFQFIVMTILLLPSGACQLMAQGSNTRHFQIINDSKSSIWWPLHNRSRNEKTLDFSTEPPTVVNCKTCTWFNNQGLSTGKLYHPLNSVLLNNELIYFSRFTIFNRFLGNQSLKSGNPNGNKEGTYARIPSAEYRESVISPIWDTNSVYFFGSPDSSFIDKQQFNHENCYQIPKTDFLNSASSKMVGSKLKWFNGGSSHILVSAPVVLQLNNSYWIISTVISTIGTLKKWEIAAVKWTRSGFEAPIYTPYDKFGSLDFFPLIPQQQWADKNRIIFDEGGIVDSFAILAKCKQGLTHYLMFGSLDTTSGKLIQQSYLNTLRDSSYKVLKYTDGLSNNYIRNSRVPVVRTYTLKAATAFSPNGELFYFSDRLGGPGMGFFQICLTNNNQLDSIYYQTIHNDISWSGHLDVIAENKTNSSYSEIEICGLTTIYFSSGPNRKLYLGHYDKFENEEIYLSEILFPDKMGANMGYLKKSVLLEKNGGTFKFFYDYWNNFKKYNPIISPATPWTPYSNKHVFFTIDTVECERTLVKNKSHNQFRKFLWVLPWNDSFTTYAVDSLVYLKAPKSGEYLIKVRAEDNQGNFQWYSTMVRFKSKPQAKFSIEKKAHCQWVGVKFIDSSLFDINQGNRRWSWDFGDGGPPDEIVKTSGDQIGLGSTNHTYKTSGRFITTLIVADGICQDTAKSIDSIQIIPAPQPGIDINLTKGCTPLPIEFGRKFADLTDSTVYRFKPSLTPINRFANVRNQTVINQPGKLRLYQQLFGPTGCIIQDSVDLTITQGIDTAIEPFLKRSTVLNNTQTLTEWRNVPHARGYQVYRNGMLAAVLSDTNFVDLLNKDIDQSYSYHIVALDSCGNSNGRKSNIGKVIFLRVMEQQSQSKSEFAAALLTWSPYENWTASGGVKEYVVSGNHQIETSNWQVLGQFMDTQFNDKQFIEPKRFEKCYRVQSISGDGQFVSESNVACLEYTATLFAPNAFTPNSDGLNDAFEVFNYGFDRFTLNIYNSWGEKIYEKTSSEATWKPDNSIPFGAYVYMIKAYKKDKEYTFNGTVTLLR